MWQRAFVVEYASKIAAIDPPGARRALDEVLSVIRRRLSEALAKILAARNLKTTHAFGRRLLHYERTGKPFSSTSINSMLA